MNSLRDVLDRMKEYDKKGYDVYFEGQGDGTVKAVAEATFIENKEKDKNKINKSSI